MKTYISLILLLFISACNSHRQDSERSIQLRQIVNSFENNLKQVPCIDERYRERDSISSNYINNEFLKTFKHLRLQPGYVIDYFNVTLGMEVFTSLYARPDSRKPFQNYEEAEKFRKEHEKNTSSRDYIDPVNWIQYMEVDDTEDGYFELLVFSILKYYFPGHIGNDWYIICNRSALKNCLSDIKDIPDSSKSRIYKMDIEPNIVMKEKEVDIYITTFSDTWGLTRKKFTINRIKPHYIECDLRFNKMLFKYDNGIRS